MRLLLDAHTLIWAVDVPQKLGPDATTALQEPANDLLLSAGTIWEIGIKVGLGKLSLSLPFQHWMEQAIHDLGASVLPITADRTQYIILTNTASLHSCMVYGRGVTEDSTFIKRAFS